MILAVFFDFTSHVRPFRAGFCLFDASGQCNTCALNWSS